MDQEAKYPTTLVDAIKRLDDPDYCREIVAGERWPDGVECPHCGTGDPYFLKTRGIWKCRDRECRKQFSVKVGTIFEDSPLGLDKWLAAIWMIANDKNGISSCEIHREIGVTQKTAWHMLGRIRKAMEIGSIEKEKKLVGEVEVDETHVGGRVTNMHSYRAKQANARPNLGKTTVMGLVERGGELRAQVIPDVTAGTVMPIIADNVKKISWVFTDENSVYSDVWKYWVHETVNHSVEYVHGNCHTNNLENFWSLLKRYVAEQVFRYNERKGDNADRFRAVLSQVTGRRLTYAQLTGKEA